MHIVVFVTSKDVQEAERISEKLISDKLAACVNIVKDIRSIFFWEGKADRSDEALLIIKSRKELFKKIVAAVKSVHSYDLPEIIALPIIDGSGDYLKWIDESTGKK
jgi:periplasmic divalent cation tolerance protein